MVIPGRPFPSPPGCISNRASIPSAPHTLLVTPDFADRPELADYEKLVVDPDETAAANVLLVNGRLHHPRRLPPNQAKTARLGRGRHRTGRQRSRQNGRRLNLHVAQVLSCFRFTSVFDQLIAWDNLLLAYRKAGRGKRSHPNVAAFEYRLEDNLWQLQAELQRQYYSPGSYHSFFIHDPKRRLISAAPFRDRVVHHALCNLLEPLFDRGFIEDSYANRLGKGTHRARARAQQFARRFPYVILLDARQFFPSIDHAILRRLLTQKISDERVLWLIDAILHSGKDVLTEQYEMVYFSGRRPAGGFASARAAYRQPDQSVLGQRLSESARSVHQAAAGL